MIYITSEDLSDGSYERFINESIGDGENVIENNELKAIELVKTYLNDRYDVGAIFGVEIDQDESGAPIFSPPIRNPLLADIIGKITLYKIFRRNSARKAPVDSKEDFEWAIKQLEKLASGKPKLPLPPAINESTGNPISNTVWGNNTNPNNYI